LAQIDAAGGAVRALEQGLPQSWLTVAAYQAERDVYEGRRPKVGVNVYAGEEETAHGVNLVEHDPAILTRQIARTAGRLARRDNDAAAKALARLADDTATGLNVMPALVAAARAGATVGEMTAVFRAEFGEFREPDPW
jgi:methylmalonyl-CoA mutase, N-terminal domain